MSISRTSLDTSNGCEPLVSTCVVVIRGKIARRVDVTMAEVIQDHGLVVVSLLRLLHQQEPSDCWTDSLAPWALCTVANRLAASDRSIAIVGWCSPHLLGANQPLLLDPSSHVGLYGIGSDQSVATFATFDTGRLAALAMRASGDELLMLQQAFLASNDAVAALRRLSSVARIGAVGTIGAEHRAPTNMSNDDLYDTLIHPTLASPTIDHMCAYVIADNPLLQSCPVLSGDPGIGNDAIKKIELTSADALEGSPSTRAIVAAGGRSGFPVPPPDPFTQTGLWRAWLNAAATSSPFPVSRLLCDVRRRRIDLQEHFPDLTQQRHRIAYLRWAIHHGSNPIETALPPWAIPSPSSLPKLEPVEPVEPNTARTSGVTVIGFLDSALGLGEAARVMVRNLAASGERVSTLTWRHVVSPPVAWRDLNSNLRSDIHVLCMNGSDVVRWNRSAPIGFSQGSYRIGLWFWETDRLSAEMTDGAQHLDEIWVTSEYTATVVAASVPPHIAVLVMPLGLIAPPPSTRHLSRQKLCAQIADVSSNAWWCGTSFDIASQIERKNPLGMIDAWKLAFPSDSDERVFVIKTMNGSQQPQNRDLIVAASANRNDIVVVDATWTPEQQHAFVRSLDVYLSLHRSEGYGLMLLEALCIGTPTIATAATGNLSFMTDTNSWLVPAVEQILDADAGPYRKGTKVSEPSIEKASEYLVQLFENTDPATTLRKTVRGCSDVAGLADATIPADWIRRRLAEIRRNR